MYVSDDKKLHFVDGTGADTELPFKHGISGFENINFPLYIPNNGVVYSYIIQGANHISFSNTGYAGANITAYTLDGSQSKILGNLCDSPKNCDVSGYDYISLSQATTTYAAGSFQIID